MTSLLEEYFKAQRELENKYGEMSVVLMEVGKFYEAYGVILPNEKQPVKIGYTQEISDILHMQIALKNGHKEPHSKKNPYMVGFPVPTLSNHLSRLLKSGFTVAIYDQFDPEDQKIKKDRKLVRIYSSATYIDEDIADSESLMVAGMERFKSPETRKMEEAYRFAIFNLKTGESHVTEVIGETSALEIDRIIHTHNPSEIINCNIPNLAEKTTRKVLDLPLSKAYFDIEYQNTFLKKVYGKNAEGLGLTKYSHLIPYLIHGLRYAMDHDPLIISQMRLPCILEDKNKLVLNSDSIYQLHLIENLGVTDKNHNLFSFLNKTRTTMGKRLLKNRILIPVTDISELNRRYALINEILGDESLIDEYGAMLRGVADIENKYRKMVTRRLQPYEFAGLNDTFASIVSILEMGTDIFDIDPDLTILFKEFYEVYQYTFDLELLAESSIGSAKSSYFLEGVYPEIDKVQNTITGGSVDLEELASVLSKIIDSKAKKPVVTVGFSNGRHHLKTTTIRFGKIPKTFRYVLSDMGIITYKDFQVSKQKNTVKITSQKIDDYSLNIFQAQDTMISLLDRKYFEILDDWCEKWGETILKVSDVIAEIDFTVSAAKIAQLNKYVQPNLVESENSFLSATSLRHPIIERMVTKTNYVSNDISIGIDGQVGAIIYGVNMSGKSSFLRSIGIAVVMAQAGMFVAADSFDLSPFDNMISKITIQDNYVKGQSLFMVEMAEVNNMLRMSNERTLILSDELCSSTETSSAHAIVAQTLVQLAEKNANFVFSTHLHQLQTIPAIRDNLSIQILHFEVQIVNGQMIFNRKLKKGGIQDTYGLEIASTLGLPRDFITNAFKIRNLLRNENLDVPTKQSKYNRNIIMDKCGLCGATKSLQVHHILFQCTANSKGMITEKSVGHIHKNQQFNLMVVCQDCHIRIHQEEMEIKIEPLKIKLEV